jgi:UDP-glucose 4-epimerase
VADEVMRVMGLTGLRRVYEPILHGVGWLGDVKRVALKNRKVEGLGFKPMMNPRKAIRTAVKKLIEGLNGS